ncbi:MAG: hypothetical protein CL862_12475 [Cyanobium sp. NAT70]|nr:hypothetical protein [Cyanobium sp. NAT70]
MLFAAKAFVITIAIDIEVVLRFEINQISLVLRDFLEIFLVFSNDQIGLNIDILLQFLCQFFNYFVDEIGFFFRKLGDQWITGAVSFAEAQLGPIVIKVQISFGLVVNKVMAFF